jgi:hypothetical protein
MRKVEDRVKQAYYHKEGEGIASIILRKFAGSCDRIIFAISNPLLLSNLRNSASSLILPLLNCQKDRHKLMYICQLLPLLYWIHYNSNILNLSH